MVTNTQVDRSSEVDVARPILAEVAATIADVQIRNRGTIGGNVCVNDPTNHFPPLLAALGASFTIRGADGERMVDADEFFLGVYLTAVGEGELLTKISVPTRKPGTGDAMAGVTLGAHGTYIANAAATVGPEGVSGRPRLRLVGPGARDRDGAAPRRRRPLRGLRARRGGGSRRERSTRRPTSMRAPTTARHLAEVSAVRAVLLAAEQSEGVSVPTTSTSRTITVEINGTSYEREVAASRLLVHFLRDELDLTGTHVGCDTGSCGACTVQLGGDAVKSCCLLAVQADGASITTVEGLAGDGRRADDRCSGLQRASRAPVRLLHAGDAHERDRAARAQPPPERARGEGGAAGEHLPLHRLLEHRRRRRRGGRGRSR